MKKKLVGLLMALVMAMPIDSGFVVQAETATDTETTTESNIQTLTYSFDDAAALSDNFTIATSGTGSGASISNGQLYTTQSSINTAYETTVSVALNNKVKNIKSISLNMNGSGDRFMGGIQLKSSESTFKVVAGSYRTSTSNAHKCAVYINDVAQGEVSNFFTAQKTRNPVNLTLEFAEETVTVTYKRTDVADKIRTFTETFTIGDAEYEIGIISADSTMYFDDLAITYEEISTFSGMTLDLEGKIGFNFYVPSNNTLGDDAYVVFTDSDSTEIGRVTKAQAVETTNGLKFQCPLVAKQMADTITATIYDGGEVKDTQTASIKTYAEYIIANQATYGDEIVSLMQTMLNYGAYAQQHFNYNTGNLAADVSAVDLSGVTAETLEAFNLTSEGGSEDFVLPKGASLVLESETTLKIYFQLGTNVTVDNLTITVNGNTYASAPTTETIDSVEYTVLKISNISAKALDTPYNVVVTDGTNTLTTSCSALTYCYSTLVNSETGEALQNVVKALYLYNVAANGYFGQ